MFQAIGLLGGVVELVGLAPYLRDIISGQTRPSRASWTIWSVLSFIALAGQWAAGASASLWFTVVQALACVTILMFALRNKQDHFSWLDVACLIVAALALVGWYVSHNPLVALILIVLVDIMGLVPTLHKSYIDPDSETLSAWIMSAIGGGLAAVAVGSLNFTLILYPGYIFIANMLTCAVIISSRRRLGSKQIS